MHHVRMIQGLKARNLDFFTTQMAAINHKQVLLCKEYIVLLHKNALSELDRTGSNWIELDRTRFVNGCQELLRKPGPGIANKR